MNCFQSDRLKSKIGTETGQVHKYKINLEILVPPPIFFKVKADKNDDMEANRKEVIDQN